MHTLTARTHRSVSWGERSARLILALALILPLLFVAQPDATAPKIQPALINMAQESPADMVRVIIQIAGQPAEAGQLVEAAGGTVVRDLHIINAVAAEVSAAVAAKLANSPLVRWISLDAPVQESGKPPKDPPSDPLPENFYLDTLNVQAVWDMGYTGEGIGVAVLDSGINTDRDFSDVVGKPHTRIVKAVSFAQNTTTTSDLYGHGTHVTGIAGGHGGESDGLYSGVAPKIDIVNLKVSDDFGMAYESDVVGALQWALDNHAQYNIRIVNMSINSTAEMSYHNSPLDAAAEILWFNGIIVVASAGNRSPDWSWDTVNTAPANDPFVITVGASHENRVPSINAHEYTLRAF